MEVFNRARVQQNVNVQRFPFKVVWGVDIPSKVQFFVWTLVHGRVLTADNLCRKGTVVNPVCRLCESLNESIVHVFLHCSVSLSVWNAMTDPLPAVFLALFTVSLIEEWLLQWPVVTNHEWGSLVWKYLSYATLWTLWKTRNNKTFRNTEIGVERICREIKFTIWYWCSSWKQRKKYKYQDLEDNWSGVIRG
ncbi:hypothetical protein FRX31_032466 [Thalictrum thalictroides]|uniref:Reverse transcriptase zinc-binding domain-containing protein n=1 Tax=Thalictrum thalictroides TaxID=46969 RepID=A0A7J6UZ71_THATH|nr:hypothetical protein FRX31_032466 [Thalictrum thalictroides]